MNDEPDLPALEPSMLGCVVPDMLPGDEQYLIRCALGAAVHEHEVRLHYRSSESKRYAVVTMRHTPKGWYSAILPVPSMGPGPIHLYVEATGASGKQVATYGKADKPEVVQICSRTTGTIENLNM